MSKSKKVKKEVQKEVQKGTDFSVGTSASWIEFEKDCALYAAKKELFPETVVIELDPALDLAFVDFHFDSSRQRNPNSYYYMGDIVAQLRRLADHLESELRDDTHRTIRLGNGTRRQKNLHSIDQTIHIPYVKIDEKK